MVGAQLHQPAINLGADQRDLAEQRDPTARGAVGPRQRAEPTRLTVEQALVVRGLLGVTGCKRSVLLVTLP